MSNFELQQYLQNLGFYDGEIDGILGPKSSAAIRAFKRSRGLRDRDYVGPKTKAALREAVEGLSGLPWMVEISSVMGLHETRDNAALRRWLRSDGPTLGDPSALPWCGDAVETAIANTLPDEFIPDNPYWARNWSRFGVGCGLVYGAVVNFARGSGGHVGFLIGVSRGGGLLRVRGGNQSNMVRDSWISADRMLDTRWPETVSAAQHQRVAPTMSSSGAVISRNEY